MSNFNVDFFNNLLKDERQECLEGPGIDLKLHEQFVEACQAFQDSRAAKEAAESEIADAKSMGNDFAEYDEVVATMMSAMDDNLTKCKECAIPILDALNLKEYDLEMSLLRTSILVRGGAKSFAKFANQCDLHGQLIETLLNNKKIMKDMLLNGDSKDKKFGIAMKLYTQIMAGVEKDRFFKVNKRLAMAAALEFAESSTEFDMSIEIDAQKRFSHYADAHKRGELDPAFTNFSSWEYRMAINSDASNEQLAWGRNMQMTYAPHITTIYDERWRYNYQVTSDVAFRAPRWTASPRTYQQLLSGGGMEGPRAWFGRFICRAFGIPVWGLKQHPKHVAMSRWTPKGWSMSFTQPGSGWDECFWGDRRGEDFIEEVNARAAVNEQVYYEKVILLECLADACKEKIKKDEDPGYVDPNKVWRSLALMQRKILAENATNDSFQRTGPSIVISKIDRYIQNINDDELSPSFEFDKKTGSIVIPASSFTESNGKKHVRRHQSFGGGTQLHLIDGEGYVVYIIPENIVFKENTEYILTARVSTVHLEQQNLKLETESISGARSNYDIKIPYTVGEWQDITDTIKIKIDDGVSKLKFFRKKSNECFGLAIKHFTFTHVKN